VALVESEALHDCHRCQKDGMQQSRGCPDLGLAHPHIIYDLGGKIIQHCLVRDVTAGSLMLIQECNFLEAGLLPEGGGLNDQFEFDLRAFALIQSERAALKKRD
jgi:hypothetical protein